MGRKTLEDKRIIAKEHVDVFWFEYMYMAMRDCEVIVSEAIVLMLTDGE